MMLTTYIVVGLFIWSLGGIKVIPCVVCFGFGLVWFGQVVCIWRNFVRTFG